MHKKTPSLANLVKRDILQIWGFLMQMRAIELLYGAQVNSRKITPISHTANVKKLKIGENWDGETIKL